MDIVKLEAEKPEKQPHADRAYIRCLRLRLGGRRNRYRDNSLNSHNLQKWRQIDSMSIL